MKTLAARMMSPGTGTKILRAAAIAAPMVLVECGGAARNDARPPAPSMVVEIPAGRTHAADDVAAKPQERKKIVRSSQGTSVLNANLYPGCVVEARLSVIRPDDSLDRVVMDPKVDFFVLDTGARYYSPPERICSGVPQCDISRLVKPLRHQAGGVQISVSYTPAPGSEIAPSETRTIIMHDEIISYCH